MNLFNILKLVALAQTEPAKIIFIGSTKLISAITPEVDLPIFSPAVSKTFIAGSSPSFARLNKDLIKYVDGINLKHGAPTEITDPYTQEVFEIEKKGIAVGLKLLRSQVRHLGTEKSHEVYGRLEKYIEDNVRQE